jgi:hypothetical protein
LIREEIWGLSCTRSKPGQTRQAICFSRAAVPAGVVNGASKLTGLVFDFVFSRAHGTQLGLQSFNERASSVGRFPALARFTFTAASEEPS